MWLWGLGGGLLFYGFCKYMIKVSGKTNILTTPYNRWITWATCHPSHLKPFLPLEVFPEHQLFEQQTPIIRQEIVSYLQQFHTLSANTSSAITFGKNFAEDGWRVVLLQFYAKHYPHVEQYFPETLKCLQACQGRVHIAMFSILQPFTQIRLHVGPFRGSMRYHLGLFIPSSPDCYLQLNGEQYRWKNGGSVLFDDTYPHLVVNNTPEVRIVLFLDIQRTAPSLRQPMAFLNHILCRLPIIHHLSELNDKNEQPVPI